MKSVVFSLGKKKYNNRKNYLFPQPKIDFKYIFKRYGSVIFFTAVLIMGLTLGSIVSKSLDKATISRLDFLFTTNLPTRLKDGAIGAFLASFSSDFIFLILAFFMGLSLWGIVFLPILTLFKGFGIGISAGYLFSAYGIKGVLFYITILLPGIILFSLILVYQSSISLNISKRLCKSLFSGEDFPFSAPFKMYLQRSLVYLLGALLAAVLDMSLWFTFAGLFKF